MFKWSLSNNDFFTNPVSGVLPRLFGQRKSLTKVETKGGENAQGMVRVDGLGDKKFSLYSFFGHQVYFLTFFI